MICSMLGYDSDKVVDNSTLGLLRAICPPTTQLMTIFFFAQFIANYLHEQLNDLSLKAFWLKSYFVYFFLFYRVNNFQGLNLKDEDTIG